MTIALPSLAQGSGSAHGPCICYLCLQTHFQQSPFKLEQRAQVLLCLWVMVLNVMPVLRLLLPSWHQLQDHMELICCTVTRFFCLDRMGLVKSRLLKGQSGRRVCTRRDSGASGKTRRAGRWCITKAREGGCRRSCRARLPAAAASVRSFPSFRNGLGYVLPPLGIHEVLRHHGQGTDLRRMETEEFVKSASFPHSISGS